MLKIIPYHFTDSRFSTLLSRFNKIISPHYRKVILNPKPLVLSHNAGEKRQRRQRVTEVKRLYFLSISEKEGELHILDDFELDSSEAESGERQEDGIELKYTDALREGNLI